MSKTKRKAPTGERPIWGLPKIGEYLGVTEFTLLRWIKLGARETAALRKSTRGRWYAYASDLDEVMRS